MKEPICQFAMLRRINKAIEDFVRHHNVNLISYKVEPGSIEITALSIANSAHMQFSFDRVESLEEHAFGAFAFKVGA